MSWSQMPDSLVLQPMRTADLLRLVQICPVARGSTFPMHSHAIVAHLRMVTSFLPLWRALLCLQFTDHPALTRHDSCWQQLGVIS